MQLHALPAFDDNYIWALTDDAGAGRWSSIPARPRPVLAAAATGLRPARHPAHPPPPRPHRRRGRTAARWPRLPVIAPHDDAHRHRDPARGRRGRGSRIDDWHFEVHGDPGPYPQPHRIPRPWTSCSAAIPCSAWAAAACSKVPRRRCWRRWTGWPPCPAPPASAAVMSTPWPTRCSPSVVEPANPALRRPQRGGQGHALAGQADGAQHARRGTRLQSVPACRAAGGPRCGRRACRPRARGTASKHSPNCGAGKTGSAHERVRAGPARAGRALLRRCCCRPASRRRRPTRCRRHAPATDLRSPSRRHPQRPRDLPAVPRRPRRSGLRQAGGSPRWRSISPHAPKRMATRNDDVLPLFGYVVDAVREAHLPTEYALIPFVESGYKPGARSPAGPAGLWQMIAITARNHNVPMRAGYDGRLSPVDSTKAAVRYLKTLHGMFAGDWRLAVMAYNAGEYRVLGALKRGGQNARNAKPENLAGAVADHPRLRAQAARAVVPAGAGGRPRRMAARARSPGAGRCDAVAAAERRRRARRLGARNGQDAAQLRRLNPAFADGRVARADRAAARAGAGRHAAQRGCRGARRPRCRQQRRDDAGSSRPPRPIAATADRSRSIPHGRARRIAVDHRAAATASASANCSRATSSTAAQRLQARQGAADRRRRRPGAAAASWPLTPARRHTRVLLGPPTRRHGGPWVSCKASAP